jgi:hypothetical protein
MKRQVLFVSAAVLASAAPLRAQCSNAAIQVRQACTFAVDMVNYMTPQLSTAIAGGSSSLGQSGALGGLGRFALSIRGTGVLNGAYPLIGDQGFRTDGGTQDYATEKTIIPGAGVDFAVGLTKGWPIGPTNIGGIDVLVSALYLPDVEGEDGEFSIKANDGNLKLGYGLRIGVLDETMVTPGLYVSYLQRDLPTVSLTGEAEASSGIFTADGSFALNNFSVKTSALRLVAAKNFVVFGLQAGIGQDTYKATADISATVAGQNANAAANMSMTRMNYFGGFSINLVAFKVVGEYGVASGGSLDPLTNSFDGSKDAAGSRTYGSLGLRIAF